LDGRVSPDDFDGGWDNRVRLVDGRWVERTPRFPDREPQLRREARLLPWLAPQLPLPVPVPEVVADQPFTIRYAYLPGDACAGTSATQGADVGAFLRALHGLDPAEAAGHGAWAAADWHAERVASLDRMRSTVLPLLPRHVAGAGALLLDRMAAPPAAVSLVHGDLGPEHLRTTGPRVTGVIDWGDSGLGDPAIDLAWTAFGAAPAFADAVLAAYGADDALRARGLDFHLLGPWHEVLYGLGEGGPDFVGSGMDGVVDRLERLAP
jgi:aminoglycoside phosphotransferase (APT) family kinase protein